ncbi:hypothetical protein NA57DRAFT_72149 [Rhizodiscina lignyota]|uniref:Apple domain-containing protein n=1 Tax=Rhizodiscina lignyota TaxID=1504668 RepID=A0A9P4M9T7_9PEZI|nr:hypothetical protein NA57DRAFT_72149 [Rhizodiscina lignyota]
MAYLAILSLLSLAAGAAAQLQLSTIEQCSTIMGSEPPNGFLSTRYVDTVTEKWYPKTVVQTLQDTVFRTRRPTTVTSEIAATETASTTGDSSMGTLTATAFFERTVYVTKTSTITGPTATRAVRTTTTTTAPTPGGFFPVLDTMDQLIIGRSLKAPDFEIEAVESPILEGPRIKGGSSKYLRPSPHLPRQVSVRAGIAASYPVSVECRRIIIAQRLTVTTRSLPITTIMRDGKTETQYTTRSARVLAKFVSHGWNVMTHTQTSTITKTTTEITTFTPRTTQTVTRTRTAYAACNSDNFLGPLPDGQAISNVFNNGPINATASVASPGDSALDCCNQCFASDICEGSIFLPNGAGAQVGVCLRLQRSGDTCNFVQNDAYYEYSDSGESYVVSNGPCGYLYNNGRESGI